MDDTVSAKPPLWLGAVALTGVLVVTPGEWRGAAETLGTDVMEGLDLVGDVLGALVTGVMEGSIQAAQHVRNDLTRQQRSVQVSQTAYRRRYSRVLRPGQLLSYRDEAQRRPRSPAGGRALRHEHRGMVLHPGPALDWAGQMRDLADLRLSPAQADAITAWIGRTAAAGRP